jgi:O-antigen ligase
MCIIHLSILLVQYAYGTFYTQYFLPLLPAKYYKEIALLTNAGSYNGFTIQTSMTACYTAIGGIISVNIKTNRRITRIINYVITVLFIFGTFLTGRRGTSIILLLIMIYAVYKSKHGKSKFLIIILASIAIVSIFGIENIPGLSKLASKFSTLNSNGDLSNGRYEIWDITINLIKNRTIFGYGLDTFSAITGYASAHNSFLNSLFELGVVGTPFFYLPFVLILWKSISLSRSLIYSKLPQHIKIALLFQFLFFGSAMFEGYFQSELSLFLLFLFQFMTIIFIMNNKEDILNAKQEV